MFASAYFLGMPALVDNEAIVFYPCFLASWILLFIICCLHEGRVLHRSAWAISVTLFFTFIGACHYREVDRNELLRTEIKSDFSPILSKQTKIIQGIEIAGNPVNQPITGGTVTLSLDVALDGTKFVASPAEPIGVLLGKGSDVFILAESEEVTGYLINSNHATYQIKGTISPDSTFVDQGAPVCSLGSADFIQIEFSPGMFPAGSRLVRGVIAWKINDTVLLRFDIPQQEIKGQLIVKDLHFGLKKLYPRESSSP